jgi:histidyl-tRNA synthetase
VPDRNAAADEQGPVRAPTGTRDVLWPESHRWERLVATFADGAQRAGFGLVLNPMFESVRVFRRGIGEQSEVVGKEMYEFEDRGGRMMALRPEGTASLVRTYVQHRPNLPWKAWYVTPAFRYERPQAGRYRQHHQLGVEALGPSDPDLDVEVVVLAHDFFGAIGLRQVALRLNSMGDANCRPAYLETLRAALAAKRDQLCPEHRERLDANPLRVFDCKTPECLAATADAPVLADHLCDDCRHHLERVRAGLDAAGVRYVMDDRLVRGLDYYTRTTFEFASGALEASQNAVGGGGRYDGLVEALGGPPTPGVGFGIGIERVLLACDAEGALADPAPAPDVWVVDVAGGAAARDLVIELRRAGLFAERAYEGRSMKAQLRQADRASARVAVIVGPKELEEGTATVRPLRGGLAGDGPTGEGGVDSAQAQVARTDVLETVRAMIDKS